MSTHGETPPANGAAQDTGGEDRTLDEALGMGRDAGDGAGHALDLVATLEAEKADLRDRLMRSLAEMENLRRRSEREAVDARTYAVTGFARDMLNVADNVRRSLESAPTGESAEAVKALIEGVELTERDLLKTLDRHGVKLLEPEGQRFDPNVHQAMFEVPREDVPSGTVVQVVQSGYTIGDRVLRPALVGIAKNAGRTPPKGEPASFDGVEPG